MKRHPTKSRRGLTLVEVMTMMATLVVIMGMTAALFSVMYRLSESGADHVEREAAIARIGRVFRQDVRSAGSLRRCDPGGSSEKLAIGQSGGRVIEYAVIPSGVSRLVWEDGSLVTQDRFPLPSSALTKFERGSVEGVPTVAIAFDRRTLSARAGAKAPSRRFRIVAALRPDRLPEAQEPPR